MSGTKILLAAVVSGLTTLAVPFSAQADGFICHTAEEDLNIKIYHSDSFSEPVAAVMVLSDPNAVKGGRTIARFKHNEGLSNAGTLYTASVDHAVSEGGSTDVLGTRLVTLQTIRVNLDCDIEALRSGEVSDVFGVIQTTLKDGSEIDSNVSCEYRLGSDF